MYRLTWRLPLAGLVAFSHLQFSQIRGRQPYLIVRNILYVIRIAFGAEASSMVCLLYLDLIPAFLSARTAGLFLDDGALMTIS